MFQHWRSDLVNELKHRTSRRIAKGSFYPLGATLTQQGVNFAIYSQHAVEVFLLLFDSEDGDPTDIIRLSHRTRNIWHTFVPGLQSGQFYGYKVRGSYLPQQGHRFNEHKLLLDPYARAFTGKLLDRDNLLLGYDPGSPLMDLQRDERDNSSIVPKAIVVDDRFDWQGDTAPDVPLEKLIIYEVHLKGFTAHPSSGVRYPGTYLGFVEKIPHLKALAINAVELLPVQECYVEDALLERGLTNYWGYNTIGFFAPELSYGTCRRPGCQVDEFKTLVLELHRAGIKVILDVAYNHSGEGNHLGPTLSFKGIDNPTYYALKGPPDEPFRYFENYTATGNTLNLDHPAVIRLVMDSLRYWVEVMHVDGFRFDLASVLGRAGEKRRFQASASFFDVVSQDPVLNRSILIAEPWDIGTYQVGNFPIDWSEWNGRFRDTVRRFGRGDDGQVSDLGWRLTGSADLYGDDGRSAYNSINFITCHDGFTLQDLVSYNCKHNEANGEDNRDGSNENHSWNCGVEGETDDPQVLQLRRQLIKNYICYLLFSAGTPMILGGDEFLRTQKGNNNAYCQDNEVSWYDWGLLAANADIFEFFKKTIAFARRYTILQRRKFFLGVDLDADRVADLIWFGKDLNPPDWQNPELRTLSYQLDGSEEDSEMTDYLLFLILNSESRPQQISLPRLSDGKQWYRILDTSLPAAEDFLEAGQEVLLQPSEVYLAKQRSTVVLLAR